jgi:hypothetical protein
MYEQIDISQSSLCTALRVAAVLQHSVPMSALHQLLGHPLGSPACFGFADGPTMAFVLVVPSKEINAYRESHHISPRIQEGDSYVLRLRFMPLWPAIVPGATGFGCSNTGCIIPI